MNWNGVRGSNNQGKCFNGSGVPGVARSWYQGYEAYSLEEAIVGDSFYYAGVVDGVVFLRELSLSEGVLINEVSFGPVSCCDVSADRDFVAAGGKVLCASDMSEVFSQRDINKNVCPDTMTDITVVNDVFYCSGGVHQNGVDLVNGVDNGSVAIIEKAECFLCCDGSGTDVFFAQGGVLFLDRSGEFFLRSPVEGSVDGGFFSDDGCFYMKIAEGIFRVERCSEGGVVHLCDTDEGFVDFFTFKKYLVVVSRERNIIDVYDCFSGEHVHSHPIKVNAIVSGFMRGGIYYSNYDHYPVAYDVMSGELVWRSEDRVTTSKVIGTSKAVIYKFVGGGYQCYYMG